jgi:hypothetical protein
MDFIRALAVANEVFGQYKIDQFKWWRKLDGTPMLNDLSVRMAEAFRDEFDAAPAVPSPAPVAPSGCNWLPIESAPKDGTLILLGRTEDEENDRGEISTPGRWHEEDHDGPDNMGHDAGFMDDEFQQFSWGRSFGNPAYRNGGFQPTHWMPLPSAPAASPLVDEAKQIVAGKVE